MAAFPTIYRRGTELHSPIVGDFDDSVAHDPTIRSQSEGGYVTSRARFTRIARGWTINYNWVTKANKNTLKAFEEARKVGADSFTWTNPEDDTSYTVRFFGKAKYIAHEHTNFLYWMIEYMFEEV